MHVKITRHWKSTLRHECQIELKYEPVSNFGLNRFLYKGGLTDKCSCGVVLFSDHYFLYLFSGDEIMFFYLTSLNTFG